MPNKINKLTMSQVNVLSVKIIQFQHIKLFSTSFRAGGGLVKGTGPSALCSFG